MTDHTRLYIFNRASMIEEYNLYDDKLIKASFIIRARILLFKQSHIPLQLYNVVIIKQAS